LQVKNHDAARHHVAFTGLFLDFTRYWGFQPRVCEPYRARTKGKREKGVCYVKKNAITGRSFDSCWVKARDLIDRISRKEPTMFIHWELGICTWDV
jgi:transposase